MLDSLNFFATMVFVHFGAGLDSRFSGWNADIAGLLHDDRDSGTKTNVRTKVLRSPKKLKKLIQKGAVSLLRHMKRGHSSSKRPLRTQKASFQTSRLVANQIPPEEQEVVLTGSDVEERSRRCRSKQPEMLPIVGLPKFYKPPAAPTCQLSIAETNEAKSKEPIK
ncbi:hypothetical protein BT69DRAFT_1293325 [Atractiella rhizophila]|nr:hypothetical protein BT69DRAFT_1293325 [Atractiella rhizophila]